MLDVSRLTPPAGRTRYLTDAEREPCCWRPWKIHRFMSWVLALSTAARQGALLKLTWQDIELDRICVRSMTRRTLRSARLTVYARSCKTGQQHGNQVAIALVWRTQLGR